AGVFRQLRSTLDRIWRVKPNPRRWFVALLQDYVVSVLVVTVCGSLGLALLLPSLLPAILHEKWSEFMTWSQQQFVLADLGVTLFVSAGLFALAYRFLSDRELHVRHIWGGAVVAGLLFTAGKWAVGSFLGQNLLSSAYGAAGSLLLFVAWIYYSAQVFYFGAEVIRVRLGLKRTRLPPPANVKASPAP